MPVAELKKFIAQNFLFSDDASSIGDHDSLMSDGTLDSTGILELIMFVEEKFKVKVPDEDMRPENFESVSAIATYLQQKMRAA